MNSPASDARDRLLQAAIEEFAASGYEAATVRRICSRADVNVNAVKYYFADKHGLYVEAVKEAHRSRMRGMGGLSPLGLADLREQSPELRLRAFVHQMTAMAFAPQTRGDAKHLLIFREIANPSEATQHIVQEFIQPHFDLLNDILRELLPASTASMDRHLLAFSVVGQCMHYKVAAPVIAMLIPESERSELTVQRTAEHIFQVTLAAICGMREENH